MTSYKERELNTLIRDMLGSYVSTLSNKAKMRRCFKCGEPFRLNNKNRYYCNSQCSRSAHYLKFSIKKGR